MNILWLRPSKGDHISVRRERIAAHLEPRGFDITIRDASGSDALGAIREALAGDYDLIVGNVRIGLYLGYPLSVLLRKPFIGDVSDPISDIESLPEPLFRFCEYYEWSVLSRADAAVFVYESSYETAISKGIDEAVRLPNAVDYEQFADPDPEAVAEARDILDACGLDTDRPVAIYLGVFEPSYCIETLLETARHASGWEFLFLGEGELESKVSAAAERQPNIYYPGAFAYRLMPGFLAHADVGFCFKDAEQPLKLKEYGAAGVPAIVRPGALEQWYDDEVVFVEPEPTAVADALARLEDDSRREGYAERLRAVAAEYRWEDIADGYERLFCELVDR